jgi:hypothetical protein
MMCEDAKFASFLRDMDLTTRRSEVIGAATGRLTHHGRGESPAIKREYPTSFYLSALPGGVQRA